MSTTEITEAEIVSDSADSPTPDGEFGTATTAALVPVQPVSALVRPVVDLDDALTAFAAYQGFRDRLLVPSDYQDAGRGKQFVTKSGWRKLATVMGVSAEVVSIGHERDTGNRIVRSEAIVRAIAPNGRTMDGYGACDITDRCCPKAWGGTCRKSGSHYHCDDGCDGRTHFSKPQHDIPATAFTRALNRACSDLFGFGEVSAEEVTDEPAPAADCEAIVRALNTLPEDQRTPAKQSFKRQFGMPADLTVGQIEAARRFVTSVGGSFSGGSSGPEAGPESVTLPEPAESPPAPEILPGSSGPTVGDPPEPSPAPNDVPVDGAEGTASPPSEAAQSTPRDSAQRQGGGTPPPPAPKAAENGQKTRIAVMIGTLTRTCRYCGVKRGPKKADTWPQHLVGCEAPETPESILVDTDKLILTQIVSGGQADSTTDITIDQARTYLALLRHIEDGHVAVVTDESGVRMLQDRNEFGDRFLAQFVGVEDDAA